MKALVAGALRSHRYLVWQADAGVDWLVGGREHEVDPLVRLNGAVGVGVRSTLFSLELANVMRLQEPSRTLHTGAFATTLWLQHFWLTAAASLSHEGDFGITTSAGYGW